MAVTTHAHIRGGKSYIETIGLADNGQSVHFIDDPEIDQSTGQPVKWWPKTTVIERSFGGGVAWIRTIWARSVMAANGEPMPALETLDPHPTNSTDQAYFIAGMGLAIMRSESNIFARRKLGFNNLPFWNTSTGNVNVITPEQENEAPTNNYDG